MPTTEMEDFKSVANPKKINDITKVTMKKNGKSIVNFLAYGKNVYFYSPNVRHTEAAENFLQMPLKDIQAFYGTAENAGVNYLVIKSNASRFVPGKWNWTSKYFLLSPNDPKFKKIGSIKSKVSSENKAGELGKFRVVKKMDDFANELRKKSN
jgi:hypothetical protein